MFENGDLLRGYAKVLQKDGTQQELYRVDAIVKEDAEKYSDLEILNQYGKLEEIKKIIETEGIEFVRIGNVSNSARQGSVMITADDPPQSPYIDVRDQIKSHSDFDTGLPKVRLGNLQGINDPDFDGALNGYGLYSSNVYLKGKFHLAVGSSLEKSVFSKQLLEDASFTSLNQETIKTKEKLTEVVTKVVTQGTLIQQNSEAIELRAAKTELYKLSNDLTSNYATISMMSDKISLSVLQQTERNIKDELTGNINSVKSSLEASITTQANRISSVISVDKKPLTSFIQEVVNGLGTIKISANNIDFTGFSTFRRIDDKIKDTDITSINGNKIITGTISLDNLNFNPVVTVTNGNKYTLTITKTTGVDQLFEHSDGSTEKSNCGCSSIDFIKNWSNGISDSSSLWYDRVVVSKNSVTSSLTANGLTVANRNILSELDGKAKKTNPISFTFKDGSGNNKTFTVNADGTFSIS